MDAGGLPLHHEGSAKGWSCALSGALGVGTRARDLNDVYNLGLREQCLFA